MSIGFYADTHISKQVAIQLRAKGVEVVRCEEVGLAEADDKVHLEYAIENGLCLLTKDDDFLALHKQVVNQKKVHYGIFFCRKRDTPAIGEIVKACYEYHELISSGAGTNEDLQNEIVFI